MIVREKKWCEKVFTKKVTIDFSNISLYSSVESEWKVNNSPNRRRLVISLFHTWYFCSVLITALNVRIFLCFENNTFNLEMNVCCLFCPRIMSSSEHIFHCRPFFSWLNFDIKVEINEKITNETPHQVNNTS